MPREELRQPVRRLPAGDQGDQRRGKAGGARSSRCPCRAGTGCCSRTYRRASADGASAAGIRDGARHSACSGADSARPRQGRNACATGSASARQEGRDGAGSSHFAAACRRRSSGARRARPDAAREVRPDAQRLRRRPSQIMRSRSLGRWTPDRVPPGERGIAVTELQERGAVAGPISGGADEGQPSAPGASKARRRTRSASCRSCPGRSRSIAASAPSHIPAGDGLPIGVRPRVNGLDGQ